MFRPGQVAAFRFYGDPRFPKAHQYHRVLRVEGRGRDAQVYCDPQPKRVAIFFLASDLRKLNKKEREQ